MSIMRRNSTSPGFVPLTLVACRLLFWPRSAFYSGVKTMRYPALQQIVWLGYGKKNHTFIYIYTYVGLFIFCSGLYASDVCMYIYIYVYIYTSTCICFSCILVETVYSLPFLFILVFISLLAFVYLLFVCVLHLRTCWCNIYIYMLDVHLNIPPWKKYFIQQYVKAPKVCQAK